VATHEWWLFTEDDEESRTDSDYVSFLHSFFYEPPTMANITASQINSLTSYDGSTNVELWIEHIERAALQFLWTDPETCQAACAKLIGIASQWLFSQKKLGHRYQDFIDFPGAAAVAAAGGHPAVAAQDPRGGLRPALIQRFAERVNSLAAVDAVSNLDQAATEDVDAFFDRCSIAVDKANYTYTEAQKGTPEYQAQFRGFMFVWFSKGLRPDIRTRVMASPAPPENMADMLTAARKVEMELKRNSEREKTAGVSQINTFQADERRIEELTRELDRLRTGNSPPGRNQIQCHCCKGFGHIRWQCPTNKPRGGRGQPNSNYRGRGGQSHRPFSRGNFGGYRGRGNSGGRIFSPRHRATTQGQRGRGGYGGYQRQGGSGGGKRHYYVMEKAEDELDTVYEEETSYDNDQQEEN
jgi:hypothetical protein